MHTMTLLPLSESLSHKCVGNLSLQSFSSSRWFGGQTAYRGFSSEAQCNFLAFLMFSWFQHNLVADYYFKACPQEARWWFTAWQVCSISLQCVELITLLMPKYVTVEEVPEFLSKTLLMDYRVGKAAGSETVSPTFLTIPTSVCLVIN